MNHLNKDNKLVLDENDVDKVLLARLSQIQYFIEESAEDIVEGKKNFNNIKLPDDKRKELMVEMIIDYLKSLVDSSQANVTLRTTYSKLKEKNAPFYWSDIRRITGVKKKNIEKVIPHIRKYTNRKTAEAIINLVGGI